MRASVRALALTTQPGNLYQQECCYVLAKKKQNCEHVMPNPAAVDVAIDASYHKTGPDIAI
jgi:hypothetical protein